MIATFDRKTPMNHIQIKAPRWKQRTIGVASYRIGTHNKIEIMATSKKDRKRYYPETYYISGDRLLEYPIQKLGNGTVLHLVPIADLDTLMIEPEEL